MRRINWGFTVHEVVRLTLERRQEDVDFGLKMFPTPSLSSNDICAVDPMVEAAPTVMAIMAPVDSS